MLYKSQIKKLMMELMPNTELNDDGLPSALHCTKRIVSRSQFKPILFSSEMVRAIISGRKLQTRRGKGLKNIDVKATEIIANNEWPKQGNFTARFQFKNIETDGVEAWEVTNILKSPYNVGDILWVRETWMDAPNYPALPEKYYYKASVSNQFLDEWKGSWKPSIFMKKETCRLFLEVTGLRAERLHEITGDDVLLEGIDNGKINKAMGVRWENMQRMAFEELWNKINKNWNDNPYVWVITFKVVECPQGFC